MEQKHVVYLAGPAYSPEERELLAAIAEVLEKEGFQTYIPWRDGIEKHWLELAGLREPSEEEQRHTAACERALFSMEIFQIVSRCSSLVFCMNGRVPDEGGVFKAAVAFAAGKPVVLYKRDVRTKLYGNDNAMIPGLTHGFSAVRRMKKLPKALRKAMARTEAARSMPPYIRETVEMGQAVWVRHLAPHRQPRGVKNPRE